MRWPTVIGDDCVVGHNAHLEGAVVNRGTLIGSMSTCLHGVVVGEYCPANYFHLLRRHLLDGIQRPLIVFTPKSMLRNKAVVSDIKDFTEIKFRSVIEEPTYTDSIGDRDKVTRILLCSGKLYYDLAARKAKHNREDVAIVRIEQLAPLPKRRLANTLDSYPNVTEFFWVQEEPANQGAWPTFGLTLPELLPDHLSGFKRISRRAMSAPSSPFTRAS